LDIPKELKKIRDKTGLSQQKFADEIGIPQRTWANYENGRSSPKMGFLFGLAEKGYTIPGLTTGLKEDMIVSGQITQDRIDKVDELARNMPPDTPAIGKEWDIIREKAVKLPIEEIASMPEVRFANLEAKVSSMEFRLRSIETLLQTSGAEHGATRNIQTDERLMPAAALKGSVYPEETEGADGYVAEPVPVYGCLSYWSDVAAGPPVPQHPDEWEQIVSVPMRLIKTKPEDYYVMRVRGNSMLDALIPDGSMIMLRWASAPRHGAIQAVWIDERVTLKRMIEDENHGWTLRHEDGSGRTVPLGEDNYVVGDFVAVLPPSTKPRMREEE